MQNPRGSNNKLTEQKNEAQNQNRLFDSQNNARGGYQVGDKCVPNCKDGNNYDPTKPGAMQGIMHYYHGSELQIEWTAQHGCGTPGTNTECNLVLQYMCNSDYPGVRDGKDPDTNRRRRGGGNNQNPEGANREAADDPTRGRHEPFEFYDACRKRQRNKGLYNADQNLRDKKGAAATRQNPKGTRRGLECPEERDYYPYWHDTPWRDIAVYTSDPKRCNFYRSESQNVKAKGYCQIATPGDETTLPRDEQVPNQPGTCAQRGGSWVEKPAWDIPAPDCYALPESRDNHLGNIGNGEMMFYTWKIPDTIPDGDTCVLRIRYNISSGDFSKHPSGSSEDWDPFHDLDWKYNKDEAPLKNDPIKDFVGLSDKFDGLLKGGGLLQVQVNTAQFGRTFEDRSHVFHVNERPDGIPWFARIVNFNVRGRRGNIVQVYPSVEYDFVPGNLKVNKGDYLHFQWTGSDANDNGNAGNGKTGTDRSNLVQIKDRSSNTPLSWNAHSLFFEATDDGFSEQYEDDVSLVGLHRVNQFAFLNQHMFAAKVGNKCPATIEEAEGQDEEDDDNCQQLNAAPAYFDGGLVEMTVSGEHHIASTRNNDFTNRSHKTTIFVGWRVPYWWEVLLIAVAIIVFATGSYMIATATYAYLNPMSDSFSQSRRPYLLRLPCFKNAIMRKAKKRKQRKEVLAAAWRKRCAELEGSAPKGDAIGKPVGVAPTAAGGATAGAETAGGAEKGTSPAAIADGDVALPPSWFRTSCRTLDDVEQPRRSCCAALKPFCRCCRRCTSAIISSCFGGEEWRGHRAFICLNLFVGLMGFFLNFFDGFNRWYAFAKCGGYLLDFNLSVILVPTMRSIQMFAREVRALDGLMNSDPIGFHIHVAMWTAFSTLIHIVGHVAHMAAVAATPIYLPAITVEQKMSGKKVLDMFFDPSTRAAPFTGVILLLLMTSMYLTANSRVRRHTFNFQRFPRTLRDIVAWVPLVLVGLLLAPVLPFWLIYRRVFQGLEFRSIWPSEDRIGGFRIFWAVHQNWLPVYILLLLHGPRCWIWFLWPCILLICDRLVSRERRRAQVVLVSAELLKGKVMKLTFNLPAGFLYQAGQYVQLCCDQVSPTEWHPFTLTSAPEDGQLSVHIRCPDELDWCAELRRKLLENPVNNLSGTHQPPEPGCRVLYKPYSQLMSLVSNGAAIQGTCYEYFSQPKLVEVLNPQGVVSKTWGEHARTSASDHGDLPTSSGRSFNELMRPTVPRDAVRIRLDGPHGAPSELVWRHRVVMLVGAGIGVTPFASILRSIQLRNAASGRTKPIKPQSRLSGAEADISDKAKFDWKPCEHVHFYWLCRSQDEFDWFYDLLHAAVDGPARDRIELNLFQTGEVELSKIRMLGSGIRQFMGRPNWSRIFPNVAQEHPGENVGVFLCGPAAVRGQLQNGAAAAMQKDDAGTTFTVHAENF